MKLSCIVLTSNSYAHKGGCVEHVLLALARQRAVDRELIVVENSGEGGRPPSAASATLVETLVQRDAGGSPSG